MKAVGVKQLKARLSEYLRLTKAGETVLVTERDEVIAELRPARRQPLPATEIDDVPDDLATAGHSPPARQRKARWTWPARSLGPPVGTAIALIDELREER